MKAMGVGVGACKWREIEVVRARPVSRRSSLSGRRRRAGRAQGRDRLAAQPHPHRDLGRSGRCRTLTFGGSRPAQRYVGPREPTIGEVRMRLRSLCAVVVAISPDRDPQRSGCGRRADDRPGPTGAGQRVPGGHRCRLDRRGQRGHEAGRGVGHIRRGPEHRPLRRRRRSVRSTGDDRGERVPRQHVSRLGRHRGRARERVRAGLDPGRGPRRARLRIRLQRRRP